jgi:hypothetical protein
MKQVFDVGFGKVGFCAILSKDGHASVLISHLKESLPVGSTVKVADYTEFDKPHTILNFHSLGAIEVMMETLQQAKKKLLEGTNGNQEPV